MVEAGGGGGAGNVVEEADGGVEVTVICSTCIYATTSTFENVFGVRSNNKRL